MNTIFTIERVSNPEIEVFTLGQMKTYLRAFLEETDEDDDITEKIKAAREWAEDETGRALIDQQWRMVIVGPQVYGDAVTGYTIPPPTRYTGQFFISPVGEILLRRSPVLEVVRISMLDSTGVETTVDPATYQLRDADTKYPRIFPLNNATWFVGGSLGGDLRIQFRAGFANRDVSPQQGAEAVPAVFKQAMKLWIEAHYDRDAKSVDKMIEVACGLLDNQRATNLGMA